jgi:subtilisin family serine protease
MKKRYIIVPKDDRVQKGMSSIQKEFDVKMVSSKELNSKVRSKSILASDRGLFFKNLGVSVVDIEEKKLMDVLSRENSILYWEEEREFHPVGERDYFDAIKSTLEKLNEQINELEKSLEKKEDTPKEVLEAYRYNLNSMLLEKSKYSGKGINVAILDTGFYAEHPDFVNRNIEGKSFIDGEAWDFDGYGHGTHCTGVAVGYLSLKDKKRYGIAYESNIFIGKVLSDSGNGFTSSILDGIDWALEKMCSVISLSLGSSVKIGEKPSAIFEHIGRKALEKNSLIIAAAGNDSQRPDYIPKPVSCPANAESIMAVAAVNESLTIANFSNAGLNAGDGGRVDIAAAGVNIFSAYSKNARSAALYKKMNGTSMATPHVSGVAALYFEAFPNLTATEIWLKIEKNAKSLEGQRFRDVGAGIIQVV